MSLCREGRLHRPCVPVAPTLLFPCNPTSGKIDGVSDYGTVYGDRDDRETMAGLSWCGNVRRLVRCADVCPDHGAGRQRPAKRDGRGRAAGAARGGLHVCVAARRNGNRGGPVGRRHAAGVSPSRRDANQRRGRRSARGGNRPVQHLVGAGKLGVGPVPLHPAPADRLVFQRVRFSFAVGCDALQLSGRAAGSNGCGYGIGRWPVEADQRARGTQRVPG